MERCIQVVLVHEWQEWTCMQITVAAVRFPLLLAALVPSAFIPPLHVSVRWNHGRLSHCQPGRALAELLVWRDWPQSALTSWHRPRAAVCGRLWHASSVTKLHTAGRVLARRGRPRLAPARAPLPRTARNLHGRLSPASPAERPGRVGAGTAGPVRVRRGLSMPARHVILLPRPPRLGGSRAARPPGRVAGCGRRERGRRRFSDTSARMSSVPASARSAHCCGRGGGT